MPRIQQLEQFKGLTAADLTKQNTVGPMPKSRFQQIANRHGWNSTLFTTRFKAHEVGVAQLDLRGVFDEQDPFVIGNEFGEDSESSGLARSWSAEHERMGDILVVEIQEVRRAVAGFKDRKIFLAEMRVPGFALVERKEERIIGVVGVEQVE